MSTGSMTAAEWDAERESGARWHKMYIDATEQLATAQSECARKDAEIARLQDALREWGKEVREIEEMCPELTRTAHMTATDRLLTIAYQLLDPGARPDGE